MGSCGCSFHPFVHLIPINSHHARFAHMCLHVFLLAEGGPGCCSQGCGLLKTPCWTVMLYIKSLLPILRWMPLIVLDLDREQQWGGSLNNCGNGGQEDAPRMLQFLHSAGAARWHSSCQSKRDINKLYNRVKRKYSGHEKKWPWALWESIQVNVFFSTLLFFFHHLTNARSDARSLSDCIVLNGVKTIVPLSRNTNISFTEVLQVQDASSEVRAWSTANKYSSLAQP